ncbi:MAG: hypothetical protein KKH88_00550 [Nanoarchaeota archaeon]|nr:hypothetical protein [Nanoarchaeota archaeon]
MDEKDIGFGVQIAFLGSISLLTAGFIKDLNFIQNSSANPFSLFILSGVLLLLASSLYFLLRFAGARSGTGLNICGISIMFAIIFIFIGSVFILLSFFGLLNGI